jgi:hypothetical protein
LNDTRCGAQTTLRMVRARPDPHPKQHVIMNSVLSLGGAAHRYRRKVSAAEIRADER